jgi:large subunit ribosomal protein L24
MKEGAMAVKVKIRKGDKVRVISGGDKGEEGEVIRVLAEQNRVVVQGVNIRKKHTRAQQTTSGQSRAGGVIEFEASLQLSNVQLVCPACGKPTRIGLRRGEDGSARVCKECGATIE